MDTYMKTLLHANILLFHDNMFTINDFCVRIFRYYPKIPALYPLCPPEQKTLISYILRNQ